MNSTFSLDQAKATIYFVKQNGAAALAGDVVVIKLREIEPPHIHFYPDRFVAADADGNEHPQITYYAEYGLAGCPVFEDFYNDTRKALLKQ